MTEQELLEKIVEVIENTEFVTGCYPKNIVNIKQRTTYDSHSSFTNFVTTISFDFACVLADALLRSEIGDVKDLQAQVNALEMTNIALQAGYDDAEKDRLYWVDKYKEAEHRAEKAEQLKNQYCRALLNLARRYVVKTNMTLPHGNEPHSRSTDIEMLAPIL